MNWLVRLLARILARYEGATQTTSRSYIPGGVQSARFDASASTRMELVRRANYFEKNSNLLNRLADLFECYTVGAGLQLTPSSSDPQWNENAKMWLDEWSAFCDYLSRQSFGTLQGLIARTWFIQGEIFVVKKKGQSNRPRLQLIEGHLVGTPPQFARREDIIDGVQIDSNGRPIGYFIANEDSRGQKTWGSPTPAEFVEHIFEPSRPGQYRGLPFIYPVINILHDLDDLQILEMKACKDAADTTNVIKTKTGEVSAAQMMRQRFSASTQISTGATVPENKSSYYREAIGGNTRILQHGDEMEQFKSERPSVATKDYWRMLKEEVCCGVGIPYILAFPESVQGTVYRGALDCAATFFQVRSMVIADALRRLYQTHIMQWARINERQLRDAPGDWFKVSIRPPRAPNVDVGRNSAAMLAELAAGATNYERIYGPLGADWREELTKLNEQLAFIETLPALKGRFAQQKPQDEKEPAYS